jgi:hypothetical protein
MSYASYQVATDGDQPSTSNHISPEDRSISIRSGNGVTTYHGGQAIEQDTYQNINTANLDPSGGLKARTPTGSPRQGSLQMGDIVSVGGTETTVQNAAALGLIEQDQSGRWVLVPDGPSRALASEATPEETPDEGEALPDASIEANLAGLCASITPTTQVAMAQQIIASGEINSGTLARAAGEGSIEPEVLNERISSVMDGFQAQADSTVRKLGADDTQQFYDWCRQNHPDGLRKAMNDHVMGRTTQGYQPLFNAYVETLAEHSPEDVINASFGSGITARMVNNQVILDIPGNGQMPFRSAVKAGLIKVTGA